MSKSLELEARVRELIRTGVWAPETRIPSETALCGEFGVSRTTVRAALTALRSEGRLVSRPRVGTVVASVRSRRPLHLIIRSVNRLVAQAFCFHFIRFGMAHPEFEIFIHDNADTPRRLEAVMEEALMSPDSLIISTVMIGEASRRLAADHSDRVAILGSAPELSGICCQVFSDLQAGGEMMMNYLMDNGHRRIAYLGGFLDGCRYLAWKNSLSSRGLEADEALAGISESRIDCSQTAIVKFAVGFLKKLLACREPVTAVYCIADVWALAMLHAACALGVRVPEDLSISGFDGVFVGMADDQGSDITTVVQPFERIFTSAVSAMNSLSGERPRVLLRPELFRGRTVARIGDPVPTVK